MFFVCLLFGSYSFKCYMCIDLFNIDNSFKSCIIFIGFYNYFYFTYEKIKF